MAAQSWYFDRGGGYYIYRSYYGVGGRGEMSESPEDGKPMMTFNGFMYDFVLRSDGVLMPNQNGDGDGLNIHRNTFKRVIRQNLQNGRQITGTACGRMQWVKPLLLTRRT